MNAIKLLAETPETVTISRADLDALIDAAENAEDTASVRAWMPMSPRSGAMRRSRTAIPAPKRSAYLTARARFEFGVRSAA
jgi:hypothetical protein